jgi:NAD(P)-dependent dehydrogenase (short-subunit alcohol dehydrogenase family)
MAVATRDVDPAELVRSSGRRKLEGKVALITGGAKGMGGTIAQLLALEGASLVLAARGLDDLAAELERIRGSVPELRGLAVRTDVTDEASVQAMVDRTLSEFGQLDVLINTAGVIGPIETPAHQVKPDEWDQVMSVNAKGTFLCCRAVLPHMIERQSGKIVNIAGTSGLRGYKYRVAYSSSKWAVRGLTRTIAREVGVYGINVNCVAPGPLYGERMEKIIREKAHVRGTTPTAIFDEYLSEQCLKRFTSAIDVAYAVLFLSHDESRQVTGQCLTVDGGWDV